ncbi:MAG TPA: hypothetical protein VGQ83_17520 [Polyangia bacterium]
MTALAVMLCQGAAQADVPRYISFQGRISDASGTPLVTATRTIKFVIYDDLNLACHTSAQSVPVTSGLMAVQIPNVNTNCKFASQHYLALQILKDDGTYDTEMKPWIPLAAAAYAIRTQALVPPGTKTLATTGTTGARQIPVNDTVLTSGLNADMLDGSHASAFAVCDSAGTATDPTITAHRGSLIYSCDTQPIGYCQGGPYPNAACKVHANCAGGTCTVNGPYATCPGGGTRCFVVGSCPSPVPCAYCDPVGYATN